MAQVQRFYYRESTRGRVRRHDAGSANTSGYPTDGPWVTGDVDRSVAQ